MEAGLRALARRVGPELLPDSTGAVASAGKADSPTFDIALELEACDRLTSPQLESFAIAVGELFPPP